MFVVISASACEHALDDFFLVDVKFDNVVDLAVVVGGK